MSKPAPGPSFAVSPTDWGARVDYDIWTDPWTPKDEIDIHYGGGSNTAGSVTGVDVEQIADEMTVLRGWERFHIDSRGWRGLAYNWPIGQSGTVYRARGWNHNGAHYSGDDVDYDGIPSNLEGAAVVFILGGDQQPTAKALAAFEKLRTYLEIEMRDNLPLYGHQEVAASGGHSTACPGAPLMAYLEANREGTEGTDWPAILQVGSRHRKVRILNGMLYSLGYLPKAGIPHRTFDAATETAVRDFQEDRHLDPDGIVGPITRTKLYRQLRRTRKEA